jgi:hypothetical protein
MTPDDLEKLAELASEKTVAKLCSEKKARWMEPETHERQHEWVSQKMLDESERRSMRRRIIESSLAWAMPLAIMFFATALWQYFKHLVMAPKP